MAIAGGTVGAYRCYVLADDVFHAQAVGHVAWSVCVSISDALTQLELDGGPVLVAGPDMAHLRVRWSARQVTA